MCLMLFFIFIILYFFIFFLIEKDLFPYLPLYLCPRLFSSDQISTELNHSSEMNDTICSTPDNNDPLISGNSGLQSYYHHQDPMLIQIPYYFEHNNVSNINPLFEV